MSTKLVLTKICECSYTHCTHTNEDPAPCYKYLPVNGSLTWIGWGHPGRTIVTKLIPFGSFWTFLVWSTVISLLVLKLFNLFMGAASFVLPFLGGYIILDILRAVGLSAVGWGLFEGFSTGFSGVECSSVSSSLLLYARPAIGRKIEVYFSA